MAKKRAVEEDEVDEAPRKKKRKVEEDEAPTRTKKRKVTTSKGSSVVTLDFSKDQSEGRKRFKEGDYLVKVLAVKMGHSEQKGTPMAEFTFVFKEGKYKGEKIKDRCYITDKALWRIRALFAAAGTEIPKKRMKIDFKDLIGETLGITIGDDEYKDEKTGKSRTSSRVTDFLDPDDMSDDDEDDEDDEDDDDEEEEDDDLEDMDVDDDL
jgi:hypothetical protein